MKRDAREPERAKNTRVGLLGGEPTPFKDAIQHLAVWASALIFASPLVYAFFSSLKAKEEVFSMPPTLFGARLRWENYIEVFTYGPFLRYIGNSFLVAILGTLVVLVVSTTAGYAFARLRWKGREGAFVLFLATMMIPAEVLVIPMFILMQKFGWVNTYQALILPFAFGAFGTFLIRQFMRSIPYEIEEAARVDGAGPVRTFLQIILPLTKSAIAVLSVFTFMSFWNSYLWPLIVTVDYQTLGTLPVGLTSFSSQHGTRYELQIAASMISMVPTTLLVIVLQKHLIKGISMSGMGGR
ncbi:carbohydrate ABC transporter permease [Actinomyces sp. B33]|uniref:carbohydrate ABC transporter permease n=1 Tax=Actinomyces sp. B33 TaxID=2942131 RepID=UPI00233FBAE1|nr:carbohydrate ABC transporter permease [Actinomyces sp. B33]MDC4233843.1 carbohydrate ABC transporter permease [Actinomyces sp. B33]